MNTIIISGKIVSDPSPARKTSSGASVASVIIQSSRQYNGNTEVVEMTVEGFGDDLSNLMAGLKVDEKVLIQGRVKPQRNYQVDGTTVYSGIEINASSVVKASIEGDDINLAIFTGNLGRDPEMRYLTAGTAVTNFSVASTRSYTLNGEKVDETTWVRADTFGRLAETCNQYLGKGRKVHLEGRLKPQRTWDKADGSTGYSGIELVVNSVEFLSPRSEAAPQAEEVIPF
jgi:single-strand DNA-binding protein